jgi:hypothetical protein
MAQPTHSEVQVVDPVLTNMLVGYQQAETRFVASRMFPVVPVELQGFTYYTFTKKYWFLDEMKSRTPGAAYARSGYSLTSSTGYANTWGLEHPIPDEVEKNNQVPMSLHQAGVKWLAQQSLIRKERAFSADFMVTGVWGTDDSNATTDWDDFTNGDPFNDVLTAKRTISNSTGLDANTMTLGYIVHVGLQNHPDIVDRIKHVQVAGLGNVETALKSLFDLKDYNVAKASYNSANEGQAGTYAAIIDDDALICYCTPTPGLFEASAGYTFAWAGHGGTGSIYTYREDQTDSDILKIKEGWDQKVVASDVGYFFSDVV